MTNLAALFPALTLAAAVIAFFTGMIKLFRCPKTGLPRGARLANLLTALLVGYQLHILSEARALVTWPQAAAMSGLHLLALAWFFWSWRSLSPARPAIGFAWQMPQGLAKRGPYRLVRHPIYFGYLLAWVAIPAVLLEPIGLAGALAMAIVYIIAARQEETLLLGSDLGADYRPYHQRTPMLIPWRWPSDPPLI